MNQPMSGEVEAARRAAIAVLEHNASGPYAELPRTAGFGYPEPYTRDLMISLPGFLLTGKPVLREQMRKTLEALARHQSPRGHIPSLAHDPENLGASDTTPLFLFGLAVFRRALGEPVSSLRGPTFGVEDRRASPAADRTEDLAVLRDFRDTGRPHAAAGQLPRRPATSTRSQDLPDQSRPLPPVGGERPRLRLDRNE